MRVLQMDGHFFKQPPLDGVVSNRQRKLLQLVTRVSVPMSSGRRRARGPASPPPAAAAAAPRIVRAPDASEGKIIEECTADDFEFLKFLGGGCNGAVFLARCKKPAHPFPWKVSWP